MLGSVAWSTSASTCALACIGIGMWTDMCIGIARVHAAHQRIDLLCDGHHGTALHKAYMVMACIVMSCIVMAYIVMAQPAVRRSARRHAA